MPQLTLPFFYLNEFGSTALGLSTLLIATGCYVLPEASSSALSRVTLSSTLFLSPLEQFEVYSFASLGLLGFKVATLTTVTLYIAIALLSAGLFIYAALPSLLSSRVALVLESLNASLLNLVRTQISTTRETLLPAVFSLFTFVLLLNLMGNVPFNYTPTTSLVASIGLSVTLWLWLTLESLVTMK